MTITQIKHSQGFSLLELVLAIAIFAFGSFAMGAMLIDSNVSTNVSIERTAALLYAKEGIEAVRSIRDNDWNTISALTDGNHGLSINTASSTWSLSGIADSLDSKFTRTVNISASSTASFLKNVAVTVDWPLQSGKLATTTLNTLVTNWINVRNLPSQIPTDGLVAYWSFDDAMAGTAVDSVGTSTGTVYGATSTPGVRSYGYSFDGGSGYVDTKQINFNYLAVSMWFYMKTNNGTGQYVLASSDDGSSRNWALYFNPSGAPNIIRFFVFVNSVAQMYDVPFIPSLNTWYHVVATADGSYLKIYVDGDVQSPPFAYSGLIDKTGVTVKIGKGSNSYSPNYFDGKLDQVRIYNRALTPYEVEVIYSEEKP
jgi:prepilin-type N-terminal cleavage/methylation domain-containing protein